MLTRLPIFLLSALAMIQVVDKVPDLDIGRECRLENQDGSGYNLDHCIADETSARQQILTEWESFDRDEKRQCVGETMIAGDSSYVELLICLETARDVRVKRVQTDDPQ
jgi:hypothetical protein